MVKTMIFWEYYSALSVCISTICGLILGSQGAFGFGNLKSCDFRLNWLRHAYLAF